MKYTQEKGITLIVLVITVIILLIIASIGTVTGINTIRLTQYTTFQTELKLIQSKVNEKNNQLENDLIGQAMTAKDRNVLNTIEVEKELTKKAEQRGIASIEELKNGFKLFTKQEIQEVLEIEEIQKDYLINVEECIIVVTDPFIYRDVKYYMQEQMENSLYNVNYKNQISPTGEYVVTTSQGDGGNQIDIAIKHEKYVLKWKVKYKLEGQDYWKTEDLTFTEDSSGICHGTIIVDNPGTYKIQVLHGEEVNLGEKTITI